MAELDTAKLDKVQEQNMTSMTHWALLPLGLLAARSPAFAQLGPQLSTTLVPFESVNFALADFDSNGAPDLAAHDATRFELALNSGRGSFADFRSVFTSDSADDVLSGDFDGDGLTDLLLLSDTHATLRTGRGDGTFNPSGPIIGLSGYEGTSPQPLVCDVDADGDLDVVVVAAGGRLWLMRNDGAGGFDGAFASTLGMAPFDLDFADLDGDGRNDLFVVDQQSGYLFHFRSLPSGGFQLTGSTFVDGAKIVCGDLDGDGDRDLAACAQYSLELQLFRNDGTGVWISSGSTNSGISHVNELLIADWNNDSRADVLVSGAYLDGAQVTWIDAPLLGGATSLPTLLNTTPYHGRLATADLDRDGRLDLVFSRYGGVEAVRGRGDGGFAAAQVDPRGAGASAVEYGDFDGDGVDEIAYAAALQVVFSNPAMPPLSIPGAVSMLSADFNGDSVADLATVSQDGWLKVHLVSSGTNSLRQTNAAAREMAAGDLDGDGDIDLAFALATWAAPDDANKIYWHANLGNGSFGPAQALDMDWNASDVEIVDVDLDGRLDVVTAGVGSSGMTRVSIRRGVFGTFAPAVLLTNPVQASALTSSDLDGDGLAELIVVGEGPFNVAVHRNLGGGFFAVPPERYDFFAQFAVGRSAPQLADLNGDGALDLAVAARAGRVMVAFGDAAGLFHRAEHYSAIGSEIVSDLLAVDFDLDGDVDLVSVGSGLAHVLENGQITPAQTYCAQTPNSIGCAASIAVAGTANASGVGSCTIDAAGVVSHRAGALFYGLSALNMPAAAGVLCVASPLRRTPLQNSGGNSGALDCSGSFSFDFNARIASGIDPALVAGERVFAQYYFRDPAAAVGASLSEAVELRIAP